MKRYFILGLVCFQCLTALAQKKSKAGQEAGAEPESLKKYQLAMAFGDFPSARQTVYEMLASNPSQVHWGDTLVGLFFLTGDYGSCVLAGQHFLAKNDTNYNIIEYMAAAEYGMKRYKEALGWYEKLFTHSKSAYHAYQLAVNQFLMQRLGECEASIQFILADFKSEKEMVSISMNEGGAQEVPMRAAVWNLRGVIQKNLQKISEAKTCFEQALKIYPEFVLAKANLSTVEKPQPTGQPAGPMMNR